jgi:hypothetical protein
MPDRALPNRAVTQLLTAAISVSECVLPKAGIDTTPGGVCRIVPEITIWATLVAVRSLTARAPTTVT